MAGVKISGGKDCSQCPMLKFLSCKTAGGPAKQTQLITQIHVILIWVINNNHNSNDDNDGNNFNMMMMVIMMMMMTMMVTMLLLMIINITIIVLHFYWNILNCKSQEGHHL